MDHNYENELHCNSTRDVGGSTITDKFTHITVTDQVQKRGRIGSTSFQTHFCMVVLTFMGVTPAFCINYNSCYGDMVSVACDTKGPIVILQKPHFLLNNACAALTCVQFPFVIHSYTKTSKT